MTDDPEFEVVAYSCARCRHTFRHYAKAFALPPSLVAHQERRECVGQAAHLAALRGELAPVACAGSAAMLRAAGIKTTRVGRAAVRMSPSTGTTYAPAWAATIANATHADVRVRRALLRALAATPDAAARLAAATLFATTGATP